MNSSKVLITGGSGMIGRYLTSALLAEGYPVVHLSRNQDQFGKVRVFRWNPEEEVLDPVILEGVDYIIHLAGTNIGEKRWTKKRRSEILNSRVKSAALLYRIISENNIPLKAFISASATGYYGAITSDRIFSEEDLPADDFLGTTCRLWEEAADMFEKPGTRVIKIRSAVVLEKNTGVFPRMLKPAIMGVFPILGSGHQYLPWIHITDLCNIFLKALKDENMSGAYNAVAPEHVDYRSFHRVLASVLKRKGVFPPVPGCFLYTFLGKMSEIILKGSRVSSERIIKAGYQFNYNTLPQALENLIVN